jgi:catechol 2,3-dioxygenase-like lactoylglutathione lyase family enzyme
LSVAGERRALVLAALLVTGLASAPPEAGAADAGAAAVDASLLRVTLIVADLQRSLEFYSLLGFTVEGEMGGPRDPAKTAFPLNAPSTRSKLLILASGAPGGGKLGLLAFDGPAPAVARPTAERVGAGDVVLVLDAPDATALHAKLTSAGARIVAPPQVYRSRRTGPDGRPLEGRVFHVFDPDGHLVELLQPPGPAAR